MSEEEIEILKDFLELKEIHSNNSITKSYLSIYQETVKKLYATCETQQKEIEFYKREELGYIAGYEDGKRHKQTAVAMKNENAQYEIIRKKIEQLQKEIEELEKYKRKHSLIKCHYISKDKIKAKIEYYKKIDNAVGIRVLKALLEEE